MPYVHLHLAKYNTSYSPLLHYVLMLLMQFSYHLELNLNLQYTYRFNPLCHTMWYLV